MTLNYDIVMRSKGDEFCMFIPELSVIASGRSTNETYDNLLAEKEKYFNNVLEFDLEGTVVEPRTVNIKRKQRYELPRFALKTLIVLVLFVVVFAALFLPIYTSFERAAKYAVATLPEKVISGVLITTENKLKSMSEKEKEEARLRIRNIVTGLKPYAEEIRALFQEEKKNSSQKNRANQKN